MIMKQRYIVNGKGKCELLKSVLLFFSSNLCSL